MNIVLLLRQAIKPDVFDYQTLTEILGERFSKPRDLTARLIKEGSLVRIKRGLYTFGDGLRKNPVSREYLANIIYGPSYVSLDYALNFYSMIPERVSTITSVSTGRSREFSTPFGRFSYRTLRNDRYAVGISIERTDGISFLIASPEKALVDKVWTDGRIGRSNFSQWRKYLEDDLRLDGDIFSTFSRSLLREISDAYSSEKIRSFTGYLMDLIGGQP
jgi:predicted transcriptional regulator of viral defense system